MKAVVDGQVVAQSNDVIDCKGYQYFPQGAVRMDWLQKTAKTADDLKCSPRRAVLRRGRRRQAPRARRMVL